MIYRGGDGGGRQWCLLEAACRFRPHVVLLDIGLPGMDGLEVARLMRQQPEMEGTILVALSGYGQAEDIRKSQEAGCDLHLVKPAPPQELTRVLNSVKGRITSTSVKGSHVLLSRGAP